jgi:hypothetical protein
MAGLGYIIALLLLVLSTSLFTVAGYVTETTAAGVRAQHRAAIDRAVHEYVVGQVRSAVGTLVEAQDPANPNISLSGLTLSIPPTSDVCASCVEQAQASFVVSPKAETNLGGATVTQTTDLETATVGSTTVPIAPRYNIQATITLAERTSEGASPSPSTQYADDVTVRVYDTEPYADYVGDEQTGSSVSGDVSGQNAAGVDTSIHAYNVCNDPSTSGGCTSIVPKDMSTSSPTTSVVQGQQSW